VANAGSSNLTVINASTNQVLVPSIGVGTEPERIAYDPSSRDLYVTNRGSNNVTVVNGATNKVVVPSIGVGSEPFGVTYDPANGYLYVVNFGSNNVTVINSTTNEVLVPSIAVGTSPLGVVYDPPNRFLYVTNQVSGNLTVINGNGLIESDWKVAPTYAETFTETGLTSGLSWNVTLHGQTQRAVAPASVVFSEPNGTYGYTMTGPFGWQLVQPTATGTVTVAGAPNSVVVPSIEVGAEPEGVGYDPSNGDVYVTNFLSNTVTVISGVSDTVVVPSIGVGGNPLGIAYDESNGDLYVANANSDNVTVINGTTNEVLVPSIGAGANPFGIAYDPSNRDLYVTNFESNNVTVINGATNTVVVPSIGVGANPFGVAYDPSNGDIYVTNAGSDDVTVIDGATNQVLVPSIGVGTEPEGVAYDPSNGNLYVTDRDSNNVTVINGTSDQVLVSSIGVATAPIGIAFDPSNGDLYVVNSFSNNVSVIDGATNTVGPSSIGVGTDPVAVMYDPSNGELYVTNLETYNVTMINGNGLLVSDWKVAPTYSVTFTESGLPSSTPWSVTLDGVLHTSNTSTITVSEPNGTYPYVVEPVSGYTANQTSGSVSVSGQPAARTIAFTPTSGPGHYPVTFDESGLPEGTTWMVQLGTASNSSSSESIGFFDPNGTYAYTVEPVSGYAANPARGSVTVAGRSVSQDISFSSVPGPGQYVVTFEESGLPGGTSWGVTLNGSLLASSSPSINFTERNGSFAFEVASVTGYVASPGTGWANVTGADLVESIQFRTVTTTPPTNGSGSPKILGLPPVEAYALLGGIAVAVLLGALVTVLFRRRKKVPPGSAPPSAPPGTS